MSDEKTNRPLNVMFVITSMPVGGAETLLVEMLYRFDPNRIKPVVCCLKHKDVLGEKIQNEFPVISDIIQHKFDVAVVKRLRSIIKEHAIDAIVTIGAGDKMFWGRLAARYAKVPVVLSALHSTGWPDGVGTLNRLLTGITTGFIAVAKSHGRHLVSNEGFPSEKVFVIPNGVDPKRFRFCPQKRLEWRQRLGIPQDSPVAGIVAALRPEKNHRLFVSAAYEVRKQIPNAHFVIVGDGPVREGIENQIVELDLEDAVHLAGCTDDVPGVLSMMDLFTLTSHNEASPVSILEAMFCERPVVSTDVGSVNESVNHGTTGFLVPEGDLDETANRWVELLSSPAQRDAFGAAGREQVLKTSSLDTMTLGYTELVEYLFAKYENRDGLDPVVQPANASFQLIS